MKTVISPYDVWVVAHTGMYDIDKIYLNKDEAVLAAAERNELLKSVFGISRVQYKVMSLDDAIDLIKDEVRDDARIQYDNEL